MELDLFFQKLKQNTNKTNLNKYIQQLIIAYKNEEALQYCLKYIDLLEEKTVIQVRNAKITYQVLQYQLKNNIKLINLLTEQDPTLVINLIDKNFVQPNIAKQINIQPLNTILNEVNSEHIIINYFKFTLGLKYKIKDEYFTDFYFMENLNGKFYNYQKYYIQHAYEVILLLLEMNKDEKLLAIKQNIEKLLQTGIEQILDQIQPIMSGEALNICLQQIYDIKQTLFIFKELMACEIFSKHY